MGTRRQARINSRIVRDLSEFIRGIKNDDLGFVTITRCEISPDLRDAKVFVSVYGDEAEVERNFKILETAKGYLRSRLGKSLQTRVVPQLIFERETRIATADEMNQLINQARASDPDHGEAPLTDARDEAAADEGPVGDFPPGPEGMA